MLLTRPRTKTPTATSPMPAASATLFPIWSIVGPEIILPTTSPRELARRMVAAFPTFFSISGTIIPQNAEKTPNMKVPRKAAISRVVWVIESAP